MDKTGRVLCVCVCEGKEVESENLSLVCDFEGTAPPPPNPPYLNCYSMSVCDVALALGAGGLLYVLLCVVLKTNETGAKSNPLSRSNVAQLLAGSS